MATDGLLKCLSLVSASADWLLMAPLLRQTRQPRDLYWINGYPDQESRQRPAWFGIQFHCHCVGFWKSSTRYLTFCSQSPQKWNIYSKKKKKKKHAVHQQTVKLGLFCPAAAVCE